MDTPHQAPFGQLDSVTGTRSAGRPDAAAVWTHLDRLAKPQRSLGKLEELAVRLACIQRTLQPRVRPRRLVLFAADHGVVARGVSAWPSSVTGVIVSAILARRATSSALAAAQGCDVRVVDVGMASPPPSSAPEFFRDARIAAGTRDLSTGAAMSATEFDEAWRIGEEEAECAVAAGNAVLVAGEMGIGNTTSAACLTALLAGVPTSIAVGRGAGADDDVLQAKHDIVAAAVERARRLQNDGAPLPRIAIEAVAGFEIVAMAGFLAGGARRGATMALDGYVATAAALIAERLQPGTARALIAAHRSAEPGHGAALAQLALEPLLDWGMRLGEGTGALVALPLLDSAAALLRDVAPLSELMRSS